MIEDFEIDTDKSRLNVKFINGFISESYWAKGRTIETMQTCVDNSLNFGVYLNDKQIGYARVITDYGQFAYLLDLFIAKDYRGRGYSKELMKYIMSLDSLQRIKVWRLATNDAHDLYKKFGFVSLANPENLMELVKKG